MCPTRWRPLPPAWSLRFPFEKIAEGLKHFTGTNRRFEKKGEIGGVTIIDDYAHHPSEIRATLTAARNYPHRKIWCVFQPHTYTRTKAFMDEFAQALSLADEVILADIYAARETDTLGGQLPGSGGKKSRSWGRKPHTCPHLTRSKHLF